MRDFLTKLSARLSNHFFIFCLGLFLGGVQMALIDAGVRWSGNYARAICGYVPHPISDVAWELVDRGLAPEGTALYYSRMMRSANIPFVECMEGK